MRKPRPSPSHRSRVLHVAILGLLLANPGPVALAESGGGGPCNLPPNLYEYFKTRYGIAGGEVRYRFANDPGTPACIIIVDGVMQPPANAGGDTPVQQARSVAWAIVEREKDLLGIPDLTELKETEPALPPDRVISITYERYIGGVKLANMYLHFNFSRDDGTLYVFNASLIPVPSEAYEAVKRERLSVDQIKAIVARDLDGHAEPMAPAAGKPQPGTVGRPPSLRLTDAQIKKALQEQEQKPATPVPPPAPKIGEPVLLVLAEPPYLRWFLTGSEGESKGAWAYGIDAFSGKILSKNCSVWGSGPYQPGMTPCD